MLLRSYLLAALLLTTSVVTSQLVTMNECGERENCLNMPSTCHGPDCESLIAWSRRPNDDYVSFEFSTRLRSADWFAVSFSEDLKMTQAVIIFCKPASSSESSTAVTLSWAYYTSGQLLSQLTQNEIGQNVRGKITDGHAYCGFDWPVRGRHNNFPHLNGTKYIWIIAGKQAASPHDEELPFTKILLSNTPTDFNFKNSLSTGNHVIRSAARSVDYSVGCGETKGCFNDDDGSLVTFAMSLDGGHLNIELQTEVGTSYDWIAVGFAPGPYMLNTSVLECVRNNDSIIVQHSYNDAEYKYNTVIDSRGINVVETVYEAGRIQCSCQRPVVFSGAEADRRLFNLTEPYNLLLGKGLTYGPGLKSKHAKTPATSGQVNLNETYVAEKSGGCRKCSLKAHGCLMITGWMLLSSIGIFMPRYFKTSFGTRKIFQLAAWFFTHRMLMMTTLAATAAGFILIFVVQEGKYSEFSETSPGYFWAHAPIGITIMILVIANPVMALFRCGPTDPKRPVFNCLHLIVGTAAQILAAINIFFGLLIGKSSGIVDMTVFWLMVAFVGFHLVIEVILTVSKYVRNACCVQTSSYNFDMDTEPHDDKSPSKSRGLSDIILLGIYVVTVTGLWMAMMIIIALS